MRATSFWEYCGDVVATGVILGLAVGVTVVVEEALHPERETTIIKIMLIIISESFLLIIHSSCFR